MHRYSSYDPPEYVRWVPDPDLVDRYERSPEEYPDKAEAAVGIEEAQRVALYRDLVLTRPARHRAQEVGPARRALKGMPGHRRGSRHSQFGLPMIRNAGACLMIGMPVADLFRAYLATADSPSSGRDLHAGDPSLNVVQPISHMGTGVAIMAGVALAFKQRGEDRVAMTWVGDGATHTAACHEGMNLAAVQGVPAVIVIQNNQVALGCRLDRHSGGD